MNTLILNRDGFQMPADGWYQIAPLGEFAHAQAGLVQVVDGEACVAMVNRFRAEAGLEPFDRLRADRFAGLLVDFDHFSLDGEKRSEAAGWITDLDNRDGGLFAKIRWSDVGEEAVKGGRYRFLSPVWARSDCVDLGNGRVRPVRLLNAAVTNDPNLKGMQPLSNSAAGAAASTGPADAVAVQRFKWVLGDSPGGHCPSCSALAGQVRTMEGWKSGGAKPQSGGLYCRGNCHCRLEPTTDPESGDLEAVPVRREGWAMSNAEGGVMDTDEAAVIEELANKGWSDAARAASLAVRRAKAGKRKKSRDESGGDSGGSGGGRREPDVDYNDRWEREWSGGQGGTLDDDNQQGRGDPDAGGESTPEESTDYEEWFAEEGMSGMSGEDIDAFTDQIREKLKAGEELSYVEEGFLEERTDAGYAGEGEQDPVFNWAERQADREASVFEALGMDARDARGIAADLAFRQQDGEGLSSEEQRFLETYDEIMSNRAPETASRCPAQPAPVSGPAGRAGGVVANVWTDAARPPSLGSSGETSRHFQLSNKWTDAARDAALAVRRAKARVRRDPDGTRHVTPPVPDDGKMYGGGTPYFDEKTGKYKEITLPPIRPAPRTAESKKTGKPTPPSLPKPQPPRPPPGLKPPRGGKPRRG